MVQKFQPLTCKVKFNWGDEMTATNQNFSMYTGDSKTIQVNVTDANNNVIDLTGATVKWVLQQFPTSTTYQIEKDVVNGGIALINASGGIFQINLSANDTKTLQQGTYFHQAKVIDILGNASTVFTGNVTFQQGSSLI